MLPTLALMLADTLAEQDALQQKRMQTASALGLIMSKTSSDVKRIRKGLHAGVDLRESIEDLAFILAKMAAKLHRAGELDATIATGAHDFMDEWNLKLCHEKLLEHHRSSVLFQGSGKLFRTLSEMLLTPESQLLMLEKIKHDEPQSTETRGSWMLTDSELTEFGNCPTCNEPLRVSLCARGAKLFQVAEGYSSECFDVHELRRLNVRFPTGELALFDKLVGPSLDACFYDPPAKLRYTEMSLNHVKGNFTYTKWLQENFDMASVGCGNSAPKAYWNETKQTLLVGWFCDGIPEGWEQRGSLCADVWQACAMDCQNIERHLVAGEWVETADDARKVLKETVEARSGSFIQIPPGDYEMQFCAGLEPYYDSSKFEHYPDGANVVMLLVRKQGDNAAA